MAKKLSVQTVAATAKTLKKVAPSLSADEEQALRMRVGIGLLPVERLAQKATAGSAVAAKIAEIELMAFRAMGQKIYGIGAVAPVRSASASAMTSRKEKIIKALKKR